MDQVPRILDQLDRMEARLDRVDISLVEIRGDLREHIRRTEAAEAQLELLKEELKPLKQHVLVVRLLSKIVAGAVALSAGMAKLYYYLK